MNPTVIVAEDEKGIRQMLVFILRSENVSVVAEASTGIEALHLCQQFRPALLLTDLRLPVLDAVSVMMRMREAELPIATMIYTGSEDDRQLTTALAANPAAMVHKSDGLEDIRTGVRCALAGQIYFSSRPASLHGKTRKQGLTDTLTLTDIELWKLLATGCSNKEAADILKKSPKTIDNQRAHLMQKLKVNNIATLTLLAVKEGLIEC